MKLAPYFIITIFISLITTSLPAARSGGGSPGGSRSEAGFHHSEASHARSGHLGGMHREGHPHFYRGGAYIYEDPLIIDEEIIEPEDDEEIVDGAVVSRPRRVMRRIIR